MKKTPHVHAKWIKAKADGETVQEQAPAFSCWRDMGVEDYGFHPECKYRIKPVAPETRMTDSEIEDACGLSGVVQAEAALHRFRSVANAAIARALADGDVVLPNDR